MSPPENRRQKRFKRRVHVLLEGGDGSKTGGYTGNMSVRGMQVTSAVVFPAGSQIRGRIELPDGRELPFEAKVRWARKTQGTFAILREKSMGLELVGTPPPEFVQLLDGAREEPARVPGIATGPLRVPTPAPTVRPADKPMSRPAMHSPAGSPPMSAPLMRFPTPAPGGGSGQVATPPSAPTSRSVGAGLVGSEGTASHLVMEVDAPLSPTVAVSLLEKAAGAALARAQGNGAQSVGLDLSLQIVDTGPLPVGSSVLAVAKVTTVAENGRFVTFEVQLSDLGRPLASATHTRLLLRPKAG